jgi:cytochrome P450
LPQNARFDQALSALDDIILRIIRQRRARGGGDDLLGMFLEARDEDGAGLDDRELRDEVMTLFLAGHETTALALTYAFLLLSKHPDAEARLRAEIAALGERPATAEDLARLPYAHAVVLEAMRIYPPVWALGREATEELTLAGHRIPRGGQVWLAQWVNHRDPRYFDDPERFRPERWLDGLERRLPRFAYYPFGGGPRLCIGNAFATVEAVLLLVTLMRRLHIRVRLDRPLRLVPTVTLRPRDPVIARFERV